MCTLSTTRYLHLVEVAVHTFCYANQICTGNKNIFSLICNEFKILNLQRLVFHRYSCYHIIQEIDILHDTSIPSLIELYVLHSKNY
jgi:hypothetical protein